MIAPTVEKEGNEVKISWVEPTESGSGSINAYRIYFKNGEGVQVELDECDGSDDTVAANKFCILTMPQIHELLDLDAGVVISASVKAGSEYCYGEPSPFNDAGM